MPCDLKFYGQYFRNEYQSPMFIFWMLYFLRIPISDNLEIASSVLVLCGGPKMSPRISI